MAKHIPKLRSNKISFLFGKRRKAKCEMVFIESLFVCVFSVCMRVCVFVCRPFSTFTEKKTYFLFKFKWTPTAKVISSVFRLMYFLFLLFLVVLPALYCALNALVSLWYIYADFDVYGSVRFSVSLHQLDFLAGLFLSLFGCSALLDKNLFLCTFIFFFSIFCFFFSFLQALKQSNNE